MSASNEFSALSIIQGTEAKEMVNAMATIKQYQSLIKNTLVEGHDYGIIPGVGGKPSLFKPGGEKVCLLFKLNPEYEIMNQTEDFEKGFFTYSIRCTIYKTVVQDGVILKFPISQGVGNCNSKEEKYRYLTYYENELPPDIDPTTAKKKYDKKGKFKYRVDNPDVASIVNTILKMGKKRAFIDACLQVVSLSDVFSQDLEDLPDGYADAKDVTPQATSGAHYSASTPTAPRPVAPGKDPGTILLGFGNKHKEEPIRQIAQDDPGYLDWVLDKSNASPAIKANIKAFRAYKPQAKTAVAVEAKPVQDDDEPMGDYFPEPEDNTALPFDI